MPVKIPDDLPAKKLLEEELVSVMREKDAFAQDIRPLKIAIVNLMPRKSITETHLLRLLSNSPLQISITLLRFASHQSKNTSHEYLTRFYKNFEDERQNKFDGLIITGAPIETLDFPQVSYWEDLRAVMDWSVSNAHSTLHICWGAQAGLYHHHGIQKHLLAQKVFGVFEHEVTSKTHALTRGFDETFLAPHSRHTSVCREEIASVSALRILAQSKQAGVYLIASRNGRQVFVTGHPEYDHLVLKEEYERDRARGLPISLPANYFPGDDPAQVPSMRWRAHAQLLLSNWLNDIYQHTPFDLNTLKPP